MNCKNLANTCKSDRGPLKSDVTLLFIMSFTSSSMFWQNDSCDSCRSKSFGTTQHLKVTWRSGGLVHDSESSNYSLKQPVSQEKERVLVVNGAMAAVVTCGSSWSPAQTRYGTGPQMHVPAWKNIACP